MGFWGASALAGLLWAATAYGFTTDPTTHRWAPPPARVEATGQIYLRPPSRLPDPWQADSPASVERIQAHLAVGDLDRARLLAQDLVAEKKWGRDRDVAWLVLGLVYREQGYNNLASEAFTKVRASKGPLAPWGAWYEAEQDAQRGKQAIAASECERYRQRWPQGHHADACLRLIARNRAASGRISDARKTAAAYDRSHPQAPIGEQVELVAAEWFAQHKPESSVRLLRRLALNHEAALTGRLAERRLAELAAAGVEGAELGEDTDTLKRRAVVLREARRMDEAWSIYEELVRRSVDDPRLTEWTQAEATTFGWRTHRWDFLVNVYRERYEDNADAEGAWSVFRALTRAGRHAEAARFASEALERHGKTRRWRGSTTQEEVAKAAIMGGEHTLAIAHYDALAERGGWRGRRTAFYAALATFLSGDLAAAEERFTAIVERRRTYSEAARYWRSRTRDAAGDSAGARADRALLLGAEELTWYALLAAQREQALPRHAPFARDGRWPGATSPPPPQASPGRATGQVPVARWSSSRTQDARGDYSALSWPLRLASTERAPVAPHILWTHPHQPPAAYNASALHDPSAAQSALWRYAERHKDTWPELAAIADLARGGLYDLSGPLFSDFYEERRRNLGSTRAQGAWLDSAGWRQLFLATHDHHHTARFLYGLERTVEGEELRQEAQRLGWPLAHAVPVWRAARGADVDPSLVMGLMRVESTYNSVALSRVGARGAMQIMPRTGHLMADLNEDAWFTAGDLEDPVLSVRYGIQYLGLLMDRFDGVFPLAVAAYNGGPFAVGAWLRGTGEEVELDVFVELIPYSETQRYVKSVSAAYATYLTLYSPEGTALVLPPTPRGDHASIVDF